MRIFVLLSLAFYMLNADTKLNVCYTKKIVSEETGKLAYVGCKRYKNSCKSNNKLHFGKYPSNSKASAAFQRCIKSAPKFVNSGKENHAYVSKKSSTSSSKQSYSKPKNNSSSKSYNSSSEKSRNSNAELGAAIAVGVVAWGLGKMFSGDDSSSSTNSSGSNISQKERNFCFTLKSQNAIEACLGNAYSTNENARNVILGNCYSIKGYNKDGMIQVCTQGKNGCYSLKGSDTVHGCVSCDGSKQWLRIYAAGSLINCY